MEIIRGNQGIYVEKEEGTNVTYYIFPEYELHYNEIRPGTIQQWHHHDVIEETLFIITGEIEAHWLENGNKTFDTVRKGDVIRVENTPHTFINNSDEIVRLLVFRLILQGGDKRETIKNDKHIDDVD